jgi:N-acetylneuraminic acid mutarotase
MNIGRWEHTATLLSNGKVLVAGGFSGGPATNSAELYDPASGIWEVTGSMNIARSEHTATLLVNGKVLVAGGINGTATASAELYDPATGKWTSTESIKTARFNHTATLLPSGKVLVAGGYNGTAFFNSAELFDPDTEKWTVTGSMNNARTMHKDVLLTNGKVLVAGGESNVGYLASAELYDPATGLWTLTESMKVVHCNHTATKLSNGQVLIAGTATSTVSELYNPATGKWTITGSMNVIRRNSVSALLPNGKVLVAGGNVWGDPSGTTPSAELYDLTMGTWAKTDSMNDPRGTSSATLLTNGKLLVAGGDRNGPSTSAELYSGFNQPTVTIVQAVGQIDPTNAGPIEFTATFSETVTGFDSNDVNFTGSTATGTMIALVSGSGPTYSVSVTGMTNSGTVIISIPEGIALNGAGIGNTASTSTDNVVTYDVTPPDTMINTKPPSRTTNANASFTFSSPDATATFECTLDSSPFSLCVSPKIFTGLIQGPHSFSARAKDLAGNIDATPASYLWVRLFDLYLPVLYKNYALPNPLPTLTTLSPSSANSGGAAFILTVYGTNFIGTSVVNWNGSPRITTFVNSSQLTVSINATDISLAGSYPVTVFNSAPGGGTSNTINFTVNQTNPTPTLTTISPSSTTAGGAAFTLTINGTNFTGASVVSWNGSPRITTFVNSSQLTAVINAADITTAGFYPVTVFNPAPGGGISNTVHITVNSTNPVPSLTTLSPSSTNVGGTAFTLTINGTNFISNSVVNWNGSPRITTFINSSQLTTEINVADISSAGSYPISVFNPIPGGGISNAVNFTVNPTNPVLNGTFEAGSNYWTQYSSHGWNIITNSFPGSASPHGGVYAAWLGGEINETSRLTQTNIIMADAHYLHFWYWIASEDLCGYDYATVKVNGIEKKWIYLCDANDTYGWVHQVIDLNSYSGMTITLQFEVITDGTLNSNFFLDDISITASSTAVASETVKLTGLESSPREISGSSSNAGTNRQK